VFRSPAGETSSGAQAAAAARTNVTAASIPQLSGQEGTRILIKGGVVMSVDPDVGNFAKGDVLIEGSKIMEVGHQHRGRRRPCHRRFGQDRDAGLHRHAPPPVRDRPALHPVGRHRGQ
jgi:hypothetical protein